MADDNSDKATTSSAISVTDLVAQQQQKAEMLADEDPLLISQSLTYVTDDGGTLHSFQSAPFSLGAFAGSHSLVCAFFSVMIEISHVLNVYNSRRPQALKFNL